MKTAVLHTRMSPALKKKAESILGKAGLTPSEAVRVFFTQVVNHRGIPFPVNIPNDETIKVLEDSAKGIGVTRYASLQEAVAHWKSL